MGGLEVILGLTRVMQSSAVLPTDGRTRHHVFREETRKGYEAEALSEA